MNTQAAIKFDAIAKSAYGAHGEKLVGIKADKYKVAASQVSGKEGYWINCACKGSFAWSEVSCRS